jgi:hypothetical protein
MDSLMTAAGALEMPSCSDKKRPEMRRVPMALK